MATDSLKQVGKKIGKFQQETKVTSRYISKNHPSVEESCDVLGTLYAYNLEFRVYGGGGATLSIKIHQELKPL
jgi:hypothetical protein